MYNGGKLPTTNTLNESSCRAAGVLLHTVNLDKVSGRVGIGLGRPQGIKLNKKCWLHHDFRQGKSGLGRYYTQFKRLYFYIPCFVLHCSVLG